MPALFYAGYGVYEVFLAGIFAHTDKRAAETLQVGCQYASCADGNSLVEYKNFLYVCQSFVNELGWPRSEDPYTQYADFLACFTHFLHGCFCRRRMVSHYHYNRLGVFHHKTLDNAIAAAEFLLPFFIGFLEEVNSIVHCLLLLELQLVVLFRVNIKMKGVFRIQSAPSKLFQKALYCGVGCRLDTFGKIRNAVYIYYRRQKHLLVFGYAVSLYYRVMEFLISFREKHQVACVAQQHCSRMVGFCAMQASCHVCHNKGQPHERR